MKTWSWRAVVLVLFVGLLPVADAQSQTAQFHRHHDDPQNAIVFAPLVEKVRVATAKYIDINAAMHDGWVQGTPCVSGPASGAMGVHFILPSRVGDGMLKGDEPEALIYEPLPNGALRLVGVEFIVLAKDWAAGHPQGGTPDVDGHLTNFVGEPNRYGLPAFYELHVWAWQSNPNGSFADFNTLVTCDNQPTPPAQ